MESFETWQSLFVPTMATPEGLMRVADNDGMPVPYEPRAQPVVQAVVHVKPRRRGLVARLKRRLDALYDRLFPAAAPIADVTQIGHGEVAFKPVPNAPPGASWLSARTGA